MLYEVIKNLDIKSNNFYIDTTFGLGGHTKEIIKYINKNGIILTFDKKLTKNKFLTTYKKKIISIILSFELFSMIYKKTNKIYAGVLSDLGISTNQILNNRCGFGNKKQNFLDMRLNYKDNLRALDWLNKAKKQELLDVFFIFGNKKSAINISKQILKYRKKKIINTNYDLQKMFLNKLNNKIINKLLNIIRIFINNDIIILKIFLTYIKFFLKTKSFIVILSFNSLEDRLIKKYLFKLLILKKHNKLKEIKPNIFELQKNISARSAILRALFI